MKSLPCVGPLLSQTVYPALFLSGAAALSVYPLSKTLSSRQCNHPRLFLRKQGQKENVSFLDNFFSIMKEILCCAFYFFHCFFPPWLSSLLAAFKFS